MWIIFTFVFCFSACYKYFIPRRLVSNGASKEIQESLELPDRDLWDIHLPDGRARFRCASKGCTRALSGHPVLPSTVSEALVTHVPQAAPCKPSSRRCWEEECQQFPGSWDTHLGSAGTQWCVRGLSMTSLYYPRFQSPLWPWGINLYISCLTRQSIWTEQSVVTDICVWGGSWGCHYTSFIPAVSSKDLLQDHIWIKQSCLLLFEGSSDEPWETKQEQRSDLLRKMKNYPALAHWWRLFLSPPPQMYGQEQEAWNI